MARVVLRSREKASPLLRRQDLPPGSSRPHLRSAAAESTNMSTQTILIIVILVLIFGGGGWYYRGRNR